MTRTQAPGPDVWSRCRTAISQSSTSGVSAPAAALSIMGGIRSSAVAASAVRHALVTMHRPDLRLTSMDRPTDPSAASTAGIISSRTRATDASIDDRRT